MRERKIRNKQDRLRNIEMGDKKQVYERDWIYVVLFSFYMEQKRQAVSR